MKLPKRLRIGGLTYRVVEVDRDSLPDKESGYITDCGNLIKIYKGLSNSAKVATLWHEIFHGINGEYTEQETEFFGRAINMVLHDNPKLRSLY